MQAGPGATPLPQTLSPPLQSRGYGSQIFSIAPAPSQRIADWEAFQRIFSDRLRHLGHEWWILCTKPNGPSTRLKVRKIKQIPSLCSRERGRWLDRSSQQALYVGYLPSCRKTPQRRRTLLWSCSRHWTHQPAIHADIPWSSALIAANKSSTFPVIHIQLPADAGHEALDDDCRDKP